MMNSNAVLQQNLWFDAGRCFIDGAWVAPAAGESLTLHNPSDGEPLCEIASGTAADIDAAVDAAGRVFRREWKHLPALERGRLLTRMSELVSQRIDQLAYLEALDVGKPLTQARNDAIALARYLEFYAGAVDKLHGETIPYQAGYTVYTLREPHGVTGHIVPWNYPMQIIGRSVGAALAAGNTVVLKPAEQACLTALAFAAIASDAGLPAGVVNVVPGLGHTAGAALSGHSGVQHVSFTGSVETGSRVQSAAAANVVPVTLELGGKSPQLVFEDADIDACIPYLVNAGIQNAGQTCSASSRILVQQSIYDEVVSKLVSKCQSLEVGPALADVSLGPLISSQQHQRVCDYLALGQDLEVLAEGRLQSDLPAGGNYVAPTLFATNDSSHVLAQEEVFGPVQVVMPFADEAQAVAMANDSDYGLVAAVWTAQGARQMRLARELESGQVFINNYGAGGGVELPFGGVGKSGHGREKGFEALFSFTRLKTVACKHD